MVRSRKQSKRMPARKKFKIAKKVREHNRKMRKEAKKNATKKLKKDPGIPNLFPLKEQLLKELEEKKQQTREQRERERELRAQEAKRAKRSLQGLQNDAQKRTKEFEKKQALQASIEGESHSNIDRHSLKAYHREFRQVVEMADVVLEVLDAREPLGTRCVEVEQSVMSAGSGKKLILLLNKIDLVPKANVESWLKHLRNEFPTVAFKASTQTQKRNLAHRKGVNTAPPGVMTSSACLGAELLLKLLGNYCRNLDIRTSITVGVVGLPNVGKSSIINSLKRSKACGVGATPGVTRSLQEVQLDKHVKLIDSPGIVMATGSGDPASLALRNCVKIETLGDVVPAVEAILRRCSHAHLLQHYCIPEFSDTTEFLAHLARRTGRLKKGMAVKTLESEEREQLSGLPERMDDAAVVESEGMLTHVLHDLTQEEEEEEEESDVEEEMDSELSDSDAEEEENMDEEEHTTQDEGVTVIFNRKSRRGRRDPAATAREEREKERQLQLNPQINKAHNRAVKKRQKKVEKRREKMRGDGDVEMAEAGSKDNYDFTEYF